MEECSHKEACKHYHGHKEGWYSLKVISFENIKEFRECTHFKFACHSHNQKKLSYLEWHAWAEEQTKKGLEQKQCPDCKLWLFPSEF